MAHASKEAMSLEEQLEDLQRRFQLLEGERKATYETAKLNIQQNKEIISQMKDENKTLRAEISTIRGERPKSLEQELGDTMHQVQNLQRKHDLMRSENNKKQQHLEQLKIKIGELESGSKTFANEVSPEVRHIRVLENRLDKATVKFNEAQSIRKTYEAIVKRLKDERISFDNQLAAIERTLKAKERDYEELLLLSHDAYHAKEMAQAELHRFEQGVMEERNQRDKEVQEKKHLVEQRVAMNKRLEQREKTLRQQQEMEKASERQLKEMSATSDLTAGISGDYAQEERQKILDYEEAFQAIKEATGCVEVNEVIQKFVTQEDTQRNLIELTKTNQDSIERFTREQQRLQASVEGLKFSSGGARPRREDMDDIDDMEDIETTGPQATLWRPQTIDDLETQLGEAIEKFERNRGRFERMAKMVVDMKAGVYHLSAKLASVALEGESIPKTADQSVDASLGMCEMKIAKLIRLTEDQGSRHTRILEDEAYEKKLMEKNQSEARIKLTDKHDEDDDDDDLDDEEDMDVSHRKQVKYNSEQILEKQLTKNRKKAKGKKAG